MGGFTVLDRRSMKDRRQGSSGSGPQAEGERRTGGERRAYVLDHHITVGPIAGAGGWMGGVCTCGEHSVSRVGATIERWARRHRDEVAARQTIARIPLSGATL